MVRAGGPEASRRAETLISALETAGRAHGLEVRREYPVRGARIDLVWTWGESPGELALESPGLPLVGFEIESSWRTRKHLKGDYLNLFDLAASLGVIVLMGDDKDVEATARFAEILVDRPGPRVVVWTEEDVRRILPEPGGPISLRVAEIGETSSPVEPLAAARTNHAGKYRELWQWLRSQANSPVNASFAEIEEIIGQPLPHSSYRHAAHWSGYEGSAVARAIRDAGWRARNVDLTEKRLTFVRE